MASTTTGPGTLYLCATPIGNLEDITLRVLRVLQEVHLIAAEDTRRTKKLLNHYNITTPLVSYHEHNRKSRGEELIRRLRGGEDIALVSDAGMPGIADPGTELVQDAVACGIPLVALPGPTALITALVVSGLPTDSSSPASLPAKAGKGRPSSTPWPPKGGQPSLKPPPPAGNPGRPRKAAGDRWLVVARELTKQYEEIRRGPSASTLNTSASTPRGEFCLVWPAPRPGRRKPDPGG